MKARAGRKIKKDMEKYGLNEEQTGKLGGYYLDLYKKFQEREKRNRFSEVLKKYGVQDAPEHLTFEK